MNEMNNKVLLVDDDPNNLELIIQYLAKEGYELLYAPNGQKALELVEKEMPSIVLMDWEMPVLNGVGALEQLQRNPATKDIPIIITTGVMVEPADLGYALDAGAVDFLRKPFNPIELKARIKANLRIKEQHQTIMRLLKETLQRKERELTSAAMFEHERNAQLSKLVKLLKDISIPGNSEILAEIQQIKRDLNRHLNLKHSWDSFRRQFEEVHPDFFNRLHDTFGDLSPSEKKMCSFLKIGLDNTEIAQLINVETASVRKSLNRLKRKLNLQAEDNLRGFISRF